MQLKNQVLFIGILSLGLVWIFLSADRNGVSRNDMLLAPQEGFLAPEINLQTLEGASVNLSELGEQLIVVNFWTTLCSLCWLETPAIQEMYERYNIQGLFIISVNVTNQDSSSQTYSGYLI